VDDAPIVTGNRPCGPAAGSGGRGRGGGRHASGAALIARIVRTAYCLRPLPR
jgi:hypothetical protein